MNCLNVRVIISKGNITKNYINGTVITLFISLLWPVVACANNGLFYGGVGYGNTYYQGPIVTEIQFDPGQRLTDYAGFIDIYAGYQLNEDISVEFGYTDYNSLSGKYNFHPELIYISQPHNKESIELRQVYLSALFEQPVWENVSVFGLLGVSHSKSKLTRYGGWADEIGSIPLTPTSKSDTDTGQFWGVGARYHVDNNLSARLQWTQSNAFKLAGWRFSLERSF